MFGTDPHSFIELYLAESVDNVVADILKYWTYPALIDLHGVPRILVDEVALNTFFADLARSTASASHEPSDWELIELFLPLPNLATVLVRRRIMLASDQPPLSALVHYTLRWTSDGWRFAWR